MRHSEETRQRRADTERRGDRRGSVLWSGATKRDLGKLQYTQNRAAWLALGCTQAQSGGEIDFITTCICERY